MKKSEVKKRTISQKMKPQMPNFNYIYSFNYEYHLNELCKLESRQIFDEEEKDKLLFSNIKIDPSIGSFIKSRFEIITYSESYSELLKKIKDESIQIEGFKAEYLVLDGDTTGYRERLERLKNVGYIIEGEPDYYTPTIIYSICHYENLWYFGILNKQDNGWTEHNNKPCSFSNSLDMYTARALVSTASKGEVTKKLLDACCGVGTVMLEACFSDYEIEGCDINLKAINNAKKNLAHYNYTANLYCSDVKDLNKKYDAAIVDLPYNLYSYSDDLITTNIIESTAKLTNRIVIVSISDIETVIQKAGLQIIDCCSVGKRGQSKFERKIWVCEKVLNTTSRILF